MTLDVARLHEIVTFDNSEKAWVAIERKRRSQYSVWGNRTELPNKIAHGTSVIQEAIRAQLREIRRA